MNIYIIFSYFEIYKTVFIKCFIKVIAIFFLRIL